MFRYVVGFFLGELVDVCAVKGDLNCEYELCEIYVYTRIYGEKSL